MKVRNLPYPFLRGEPLKNDSGMTTTTLYKVHRITSFAQVFNIMSRQFSVATLLLWQHVSLNMTQYNS